MLAQPPAPFNLTGRKALITGAAGLLGTEHAIALASIGAHVILTDIDRSRTNGAAQRIEREFGVGSVTGLTMDVTSIASVRAVAEQVGNIDVLVNNAAIDPKVSSMPGVANGSRLEVFSLDQWRLELDVGLTGSLVCAQVFGTLMAQRNSGVILNIASDLSVIAPDQRLYRQPDIQSEMEQPVKPVTYSVIKHALIGLTKYLASYWGNSGVRVNALSPGGVFNGQSLEFVKRLSDLIPLGRMAHRHEYRSIVQFLCSDASSYMTGQNIVMDGGRSII